MSKPKRNRFLWLLLPIAAIFVAIMVYTASFFGVLRPDNDLKAITANDNSASALSIRRPLPPLSSDIVAYLNTLQTAPVTLEDVELPPVGAYVSRSAIVNNAPLPTPLPYVTSPPLQENRADGATPVAASLFTDAGIPRTLPYAIPEDTNCAPSGYPVDGMLTQQFHIYHSGIDISAPIGTPVFATHSGQITFVGWNEIGYGYLVILQSGPYISYYGHNTSFNVIEGQWVGAGSIIAWSGTTGNSSGPHIHYETRINDIPVDPLTFDNRGFASC